MKELCAAILFSIYVSVPLLGYAQVGRNDFSNKNEVLKVVGRGDCYISDGVLSTKSAYACFGNPEWKNYSVSFKARALKGAEQVQIWAGFRAHNRCDRYVVGIKGGIQDALCLVRMGYMGVDEFMGTRPLDFHPIPGEWYKIKIEVCGSRIRIFLNDEKLPRIDLIDKNSDLAPAGEITLGGGWIQTEFDDLVITPIIEDALNNIKAEEYLKVTAANEKETQRQLERAQYKAIAVDNLLNPRTDISLDGTWLFMPDYQLSDKNKAVSMTTGDLDWHVMTVPDFWTPIRIWLHGETMSSPNGAQPKGVSDVYYQQETARCEGYTFDYKKIKSAWYRQWIELPKAIENKNITLTFDALSKAGEVYINGELAASHVGMFGEFKVDGSRLFKPGKNLLAVKVSRMLDESTSSDDLNHIIDFYYSSVRSDEHIPKMDTPLANTILKDLPHGFYGDNPAGIWQPVKLTISDQMKVEDVFIKPSLSGADINITIKNHSGKKRKFDVYTDIVDKETRSVLYTGLSLNKMVLNAEQESEFRFAIKELKPRLWTPKTPDLYDFKFRVVAENGSLIDEEIITTGFRTFEVKDGLFYLNNQRYWLRGGNHTPFALAPNSLNLANSFYQLMKAGNIEVTRTHTTPYNKLWIEAADANGIGISFEGTWPWLMIQSSMPDLKLIEMWKEEFLGLLKKYRNHPSLLFWTINNEMKFYDNEPDPEKAKIKMKIISDVVREMRKIDPTRPISFDSNYHRKGKERKFGQDFMDSIDDGDIDDVHAYINWYDYTLFKQFNGEFQKNYKTPERPLISQEMSTGYPNNETGHPTRSYQIIHQNPQTLIGYEAYDWANPESFLKVHSFITGELAEALRRSNDQGSGILHFALLTWFRQVYDYQHINPYPTYYAMKRAMQPILVSAEIWGRNFYAGEKLPVRVCVVNDRENGKALAPSLLRWEIKDNTGRNICGGEETIPEVGYYERYWFAPNIHIPNQIPFEKSNVKLTLQLTENGIPVSANEYDLLVADKTWSQPSLQTNKSIVLVDNADTGKAFDFLKIGYRKAPSVKEALLMKANLCVFSGLNTCTAEEKQLIRSYMEKGGKILFLHTKEVIKEIFPEYIVGQIMPTEGDIVNMEVPESPLFDGIDVLQLRYFNNNTREVPTVCDAALQINRDKHIIELANHTKIHGYIDGTMEQRKERLFAIRGFTIVKICNNGEALISTMLTDKATTDPIAGKLLVNMLNELNR